MDIEKQPSIVELDRALTRTRKLAGLTDEMTIADALNYCCIEVELLRQQLTKPVVEWISVKDSLPKNDSLALVWITDKTNLYGGYKQVASYGSFDFVDMSETCEDANEDGEVFRHGWHYGRDSEGEYDYLVFDLNDKVTHWMPIPAYNAKAQDTAG